MSTIYWIMVLGNVCDTVHISLLLSVAVTIVLAIAFAFVYDEDIGDIATKRIERALRIAVSVLVLSAVFCVFVPKKKELYMIYGIGGTLDYIRQNPTAKQLPEKCIKAIDKWAEKIAEDEINDKNQQKHD